MLPTALAVYALASIFVCALFWAFELIDLRIGLGIGMVPLVFGPALLLILVGLIWLGASLVAKRWRLAALVLVIPTVSAALFGSLGYAGGTAFKVYFLTKQPSYRAEIAAAATKDDASPLMAWSWGDSGGPGVGTFIYCVVHDPSGTITRPRDQWPAAWQAKAAHVPGHAFLDLLDKQSPDPYVRSLGGGFYLVEQAY